MQHQQQLLLASLWSLLARNGMLLYVTCSVLASENQHQIQNFVDVQADAKEQKILADWGMPCTAGRQILTGSDNMDGFYYACLRKR